jgi:Cys-tRNA(Pro) deacylase
MTAIPANAPAHLLAYLRDHQIEAEFVAPRVPMPTVRAAANAIGAREEQILKTLLFTADDGAHIVVIANGTRRIDRALLAQAAGVSRPRAASPEAVLAVTGYPAGGVAPLALREDLPVVVDERVVALPVVYAGGGTEDILLRLNPADIIRHNNATVARIAEED